MVLKEELLAELGESGQAEQKDFSLSCYQDVLVKTSFRQLEIIIK